MRRLSVLVAVMALLASACAAQQPPDVAELAPVPENVIPDYITASDAFAVLGDGSSCELLVGTGVRVLEVVEGSPADGLFQPGDVLVSVDGVPMTSSETLFRALAEAAPGEAIDVTYERRGEPADVTVELAAIGNADGRARIGVSIESRLEARALADLPEIGGDVDLLRPMIIDETLMFFDPLGAVWYATGASVTTTRMAMVDGSMVVAPGQQPILVRNPGTDTSVIDGDWLFLGALGEMDGRVLVSAVATSEASEGESAAVVSSALLAVDFDAREVVWAWEPGTNQDGEFYIVDHVFENADRDRALVVLRSGPEGESGFVHAVVDATGTEISGWGTGEEPLVPPGSIVGGWFEAGDILYATLSADQNIEARLLDIDARTTSALMTLDEGFRGLWAVGDGQHIIVNEEGALAVVDAVSGNRRRPVLTGCALTGIGNPGGLT